MQGSQGKSSAGFRSGFFSTNCGPTADFASSIGIAEFITVFIDFLPWHCRIHRIAAGRGSRALQVMPMNYCPQAMRIGLSVGKKAIEGPLPQQERAMYPQGMEKERK
jgi:hypothetical protein